MDKRRQKSLEQQLFGNYQNASVGDGKGKE
jgi:hypothetical protein